MFIKTFKSSMLLWYCIRCVFERNKIW